MKAPDPFTRSQDIIEQLALSSGGELLAQHALEAAKRVREYCKAKMSSLENGLSNVIVSQFLATEGELFDEMFDANFLAVILRLVRELEKVNIPDELFRRMAHSRSQPLILQERLIAFLGVIFPNGKDDLIVPPAMNVGMVRSMIWKFIEQGIQREGERVFEALRQRDIKDNIFLAMLHAVEQSTFVAKLPRKPTESSSIQVVYTFLLHYCESISRSLVQEKQMQIRLGLHRLATIVAECIAGCTAEKCIDLLLSGIQGILEIQTKANVLLERNVELAITEFVQDRKRLEKLIRSFMQPHHKIAVPYHPIKGRAEALEFLLTEGVKGYAFEQMTTQVVDELMENEWLERFLGAWLLFFRSEKHKEFWMNLLLAKS